MCGIATNTKPKKQIEDRFSARIAMDFFPSVGIAKAFKNDVLPVITNGAMQDVQLFEWGLLPQWYNDIASIKKIRASTINARAETVFDKPSFKDAIINTRCIILCDGFIEYQHNGKEKQAYYIQLKSEQLFAIAGIYSTWKNPNIAEQYINSFSMLTVPSNELMSIIHNSKKRMPLILSPIHEKEWLTTNNIADLKKMMLPYNSNAMKAHPIHNKIGKAGIDKKDYRHLKKIETVVQQSLF